MAYFNVESSSHQRRSHVDSSWPPAPSPGFFFRVEFGLSRAPKLERAFSEGRALSTMQNPQPHQRSFPSTHPAAPTAYQSTAARQSRRARVLIKQSPRPQARRSSSEPRNSAERLTQPLSLRQSRTLESPQPKPLPPTPSRFRLGEQDLPWGTPSWVMGEDDYTRPTLVPISPPNPRNEDPIRVRELESLGQAMMTVDSLGNEWWEPAWSAGPSLRSQSDRGHGTPVGDIMSQRAYPLEESPHPLRAAWLPGPNDTFSASSAPYIISPMESGWSGACTMELSELRRNSFSP